MRHLLARSIRRCGCAFVASVVVTSTAHAQYAVFEDANDTILIPSDTVVRNAFTMEARIWLHNVTGIGKRIYSEQFNNQEDKILLAEPGTVAGVAWTDPTYVPAGVTVYHGELCPDRWHHVAFVRDGGDQRLYLDGILVASNPWSAPIGNSNLSARSIGAMQYPGLPQFYPSMQGVMDYVRVSNSVRYTGASFVPPLESDIVVDANTLLLYTFDDAPGSTTVIDSSGFGFDGTVGAGFPGATAPTFTAIPPLPADLNNDGVIDADDVAVFLGAWGSADCAADLDHNGVVSAGDLVLLFAAWTN